MGTNKSKALADAMWVCFLGALISFLALAPNLDQTMYRSNYRSSGIHTGADWGY